MGRSALLLRTSDGGATWHPQSTPGYGGFLYDVARASDTRGITTGTHHFFYTSNGGATWIDSTNRAGNECRG